MFARWRCSSFGLCSALPGLVQRINRPRLASSSRVRGWRYVSMKGVLVVPSLPLLRTSLLRSSLSALPCGLYVSGRGDFGCLRWSVYRGLARGLGPRGPPASPRPAKAVRCGLPSVARAWLLPSAAGSLRSPAPPRPLVVIVNQITYARYSLSWVSQKNRLHYGLSAPDLRETRFFWEPSTATTSTVNDSHLSSPAFLVQKRAHPPPFYRLGHFLNSCVF